MKGTLNLHDGFEQGADILFKTSKFPGGEMYIKIDMPDWCSKVRINTRCNSSDDWMRLVLSVDSIRRSGVHNIELFMPYLPYSRQDRVCEKGESFSLKVICQLLKSCQFTKIFTYDNHSNVASVLLDNLYDYNNHMEVKKFMDLNLLQDVTLIIPDAGARKKAEELYKEIDNIKGIHQCYKRRECGLVITEPLGEAGLCGETVLVVDDICDGGGTFLGLAKELLEAGVRDMYLFVSHGIFSKGFDELRVPYKGIGTTNSIEETRDVFDCDVFPIIY
jgi:ribose-phosphate pyrophosphokinase